MIKILFAASEAVPFMKTGGLADVTGSLPGYFDRARYDVRVILPKYLCMEEKMEGTASFFMSFLCTAWLEMSVCRYFLCRA